MSRKHELETCGKGDFQSLHNLYFTNTQWYNCICALHRLKDMLLKKHTQKNGICLQPNYLLRFWYRGICDCPRYLLLQICACAHNLLSTFLVCHCSKKLLIPAFFYKELLLEKWSLNKEQEISIWSYCDKV